MSRRVKGKAEKSSKLFLDIRKVENFISPALLSCLFRKFNLDIVIIFQVYTSFLVTLHWFAQGEEKFVSLNLNLQLYKINIYKVSKYC